MGTVCTELDFAGCQSESLPYMNSLEWYEHSSSVLAQGARAVTNPYPVKGYEVKQKIGRNTRLALM